MNIDIISKLYTGGNLADNVNIVAFDSLTRSKDKRLYRTTYLVYLYTSFTI